MPDSAADTLRGLNADSYGPAYSRRTRTPIRFDTSEENAGRYTPPSDLQGFLSKIPLLRNFVNSSGTITVNPKNTNDVDKTVRHESIHALLDPLYESGKLASLNKGNPFYERVSRKILLNPGGDADVEAPAYSGTGESSMFGISDPDRNGYVDTLTRQLSGVDPGAAKKYQNLAQAGR